MQPKTHSRVRTILAIKSPQQINNEEKYKARVLRMKIDNQERAIKYKKEDDLIVKIQKEREIKNAEARELLLTAPLSELREITRKEYMLAYELPDISILGIDKDGKKNAFTSYSYSAPSSEPEFYKGKKFYIHKNKNAEFKRACGDFLMEIFKHHLLSHVKYDFSEADFNTLIMLERINPDDYIKFKDTKYNSFFYNTDNFYFGYLAF
jgi:hypothetical protein